MTFEDSSSESTVDRISELWQIHKKFPFPEGKAGVEVDGVCLVLLDSYIAGCVSVFLSRYERGERLDVNRFLILMRNVDECRRILRWLSGETKEYFGFLAEIAEMVLAECSKLGLSS